MRAAPGDLHEALAASQRLGMLGARPIDEIVAHAGAFVDALSEVHGLVVDLGSGGGVPGLVVAQARPDLRIMLVDRRATRTDHLARLVRRLGLGSRVAVRCADATSLEMEEPADAVVARGFGPPESTGPTAARLLRPGGVLIVSEPIGDRSDRWSMQPELHRLEWADRRVAVLQRVPRGT